MSRIDFIAVRRRRIMLAAIERRQPATTRAIRSCAELALWNDSAYYSTLDALVAAGELREDEHGRPYIDGRAEA